MKESTKQKLKKFGKALGKEVIKAGAEVGEFVGEGIKTAYGEGKRIIVGPTLEEQKRELALQRQQLAVQQQRAEVERTRRELGYRTQAERLREFTRGSEEKMDEALNLKRKLPKTSLIKQKQISMIPRRGVSSFLSNNALRI